MFLRAVERPDKTYSLTAGLPEFTPPPVSCWEQCSGHFSPTDACRDTEGRPVSIWCVVCCVLSGTLKLLKSCGGCECGNVSQEPGGQGLLRSVLALQTASLCARCQPRSLPLLHPTVEYFRLEWPDFCFRTRLELDMNSVVTVIAYIIPDTLLG